MKNKFLLILFLCLGLQITTDVSAAGWIEWLKSKIAQITPSRIPLVTYDSITLFFATLGMFYFFDRCVTGINEAIDSYEQGKEKRIAAVKDIEKNLTLVISNQLLYPTRSSKMHALLTKDEFLQYIDDKEGLVHDACTLLSSKINEADYPEDQENIDVIIDKKLAYLREIACFGHMTTVEERKQRSECASFERQLEHLENFATFDPLSDVSTMQAYLSLYYRLKNKIAVKKKVKSLQ